MTPDELQAEHNAWVAAYRTKQRTQLLGEIDDRIARIAQSLCFALEMSQSECGFVIAGEYLGEVGAQLGEIFLLTEHYERAALLHATVRRLCQERLTDLVISCRDARQKTANTKPKRARKKADK